MTDMTDDEKLALERAKIADELRVFADAVQSGKMSAMALAGIDADRGLEIMIYTGTGAVSTNLQLSGALRLCDLRLATETGKCIGLIGTFRPSADRPRVGVAEGPPSGR